MDYFENIVKKIIKEEGYWVQQSVKVSLNKGIKNLLRKPTMPRPEVDLVGYNALRNELLIIEVKSFLDSAGVNYEDIDKSYDIPQGRYKLFTCKQYRDLVFTQLIDEFQRKGLIQENPTIIFGLAVGKIKNKTENELKTLFEQNGWKLYTPTIIAKSILNFSELGYENDPYVITSKLISKYLTQTKPSKSTHTI